MRPCCADLNNRKVIEQTTQDQNGVETVSTRTRCVVCFANHYLLEVPPIPFGVTGEALGV